MRLCFHQINANKISLCVRILVPLVYLAVLSFSISDELFWADEYVDSVNAERQTSFLSLFSTDGFGFFRPIKNGLWFLFIRLNRFGIEWSHLLAIGIGVVSFFPVLAVLRRVFENEAKALTATAIWMLSPTLVSSTAWLSCVNVQIMVAFATLAIATHDSAWDNGVFRPKRIAAAALFLFLSLFSYECAVAVVPILFLFDLLLRPERTKTICARKAYACYLVVVASYLALRFLSPAKLSAGRAWTQCQRWQLVVSSPYFTLHHFSTWFWPFNRFSVLGSYEWCAVSPVVLAGCWLIAFAVLAFIAFFWKRLPVLAFCMLFALFGFLPTSNCLGFGNGPFGDYYMTLASVGLAAGFIEIAWRLVSIRGRGRIPALAAVVLFSVVRAAAVIEAGRWSWCWGRGERAFAESVRCHPEFVSNKTSYVQYLTDQGRYREAEEIGREIEAVYGDEPSRMATVYLSRALQALNEAHDSQVAFANLELCRQAQNPLVPEHMIEYYRGCVFDDLLDDSESAEQCYRSALSYKWGFELVPCADRLGRLLAVKGMRDDAIVLWEHANETDPDNVSVLWNLSVAYHEAGDIENAKKCRERVRRLTGQ